MGDAGPKHLFITGCERSGTTMLTMLLQHHPAVVLGIERYRGIVRRVRRGGDPALISPQLYEPTRFFDVRDDDRAGRPLGFPGHYQRAERNSRGGARIYGDKVLPPDPRVIDVLVGKFPEARYLFLFRDPLQVANSFEVRARDPRKASWPAENGFRFGVTHWLRSFECLERLLSGPNPAAVLPVPLQRFLATPNGLDVITQFLDLPPDEGMRTQHQRERRRPKETPLVLTPSEIRWVREQTAGTVTYDLDRRFDSFLPSASVRRRAVDAQLETVLGGSAPSSAKRRIRHPSGLTVDRRGHVFVADSDRHRVIRLDEDGSFQVVAGGNSLGYSGDGGWATEAQLAMPTAVAVGTDGCLLIADRENHAVRRIDQHGRIHTVAGGNGCGYAGDGGPAVKALLNRPRHLAVAADGSYVIADRDNHAIRCVLTDGTIRTVAGGRPGSHGDGGLALDAGLNRPRGVAFGPDGALFIADRNNHAIRRVAADKTISTFAGGNGRGWRGDGGAAQKACLDHPSGIVIDAAGTAFVTEHLSNAVRMIDSMGVITTVVGGNPSPGTVGDVVDNWLNYPSGLAIAPGGDLLIADRNNDAIRRLSANPPASSESP